jgi:glucose-6-phosphate isomerase
MNTGHDRPFAADIALPGGQLSRYDNRYVRPLSAMRGFYSDGNAYERLLAAGDIALYEVYESVRPAVPGELLHGTTILHPGKVGDEYFMTKGHFHAVIDTAEIYHVLRGEGMMVMETPGGEWAVEKLRPGRVLYVPPYWAHRSVNTGRDQDLITFFVYPAHSGHDYGTIESQGFRKRVVDLDGAPAIVENPLWRGPGQQ